jgi:hypothetical protein
MPDGLLLFFSLGCLPGWYWLRVANQYGGELPQIIERYGWHLPLIAAAIFLLIMALGGWVFTSIAVRCAQILRRRWFK